jgi:antitoxin YefM
VPPQAPTPTGHGPAVAGILSDHHPFVARLVARGASTYALFTSPVRRVSLRPGCQYAEGWGRAGLSRGGLAVIGGGQRHVVAGLVTLPKGRLWATIVTMSTESLREVRDHFSEVVDRVSHEHERVTVTRNGRPAAVILSPDDLAQLEETLEILSDPETLADIREADAAYRSGDVVRGIDAVRALRA